MSHSIFYRASIEAGVELPNALLFKEEEGEEEEEGSSGLRIPLVIYRTSGAYVDCLIPYLCQYYVSSCEQRSGVNLAAALNT